jgi:hypothetical protein
LQPLLLFLPPPTTRGANGWGSCRSSQSFIPTLTTAGACNWGSCRISQSFILTLPTYWGAVTIDWGSHRCSRLFFLPPLTSCGGLADSCGSRHSRRRFFPPSLTIGLAVAALAAFSPPLPATGGAVDDDCMSRCSRCRFLGPRQQLGEPTTGEAVAAVRAFFQLCRQQEKPLLQSVMYSNSADNWGSCHRQLGEPFQ